MKRLSYLSFVVVVVAVAAQGQPSVTSIVPSSGPASGGTEVTITGQNLLPNIVCAVPCPTTVTFGDVTVEVRDERPDRLVVVTPAHPAGTVDVIVNVPGEEPVRNPDAFTFDGGAEAAYEAVLLPVYLDEVVHGGHGSRWQTDLWIRNGGHTAAMLGPWPCPEGHACPPVFPWTFTLEPGAALHNLPEGFANEPSNPGRVLWVSRNAAADVAFGLRIGDRSRSDANAGTELPVVRESELLRRPAQLFDVPLDAHHRVLLRVYDLAYTTAHYRVTLYAQNGAMHEPVHSVTLTAWTPQAGEFRTETAYAQFDVSELLRLDHRQWPPSVRIEVVPLTPGSRYWTFASITNNQTQLVTAVTPQ